MNIKKLILIGASTGGPGQIQKIIKSVNKKSDTAIVIAQHMQSSYLLSFANQLNRSCPLEVLLAKDGLSLKTDKIYVLEYNYEIKSKLGDLTFSKYLKETNYTPNIDTLFHSVAILKNRPKTMCIVLTGIGDDGAKGAYELAKNGAICINESENSSIVYGMPKAASELNLSAKQLDIDEICQEIRRF